MFVKENNGKKYIMKKFKGEAERGGGTEKNEERNNGK